MFQRARQCLDVVFQLKCLPQAPTLPMNAWWDLRVSGKQEPPSQEESPVSYPTASLLGPLLKMEN